MDRLIPYAIGVMTASVCAPKDMPPEEIESTMNDIEPTEIFSRWRISSDPRFRAGQPNPCRCDKDPDQLHYLMNC